MYISGSACCNINGMNIVVTNGQVYINGQLYVPASSQQQHNVDLEPRTFSTKVVERKVDVKEFSKISCRGAIEVYYTINKRVSKPSIKVYAPESLMDNVLVNFIGDELSISHVNSVYALSGDMDMPSVEIVTNGGVKKYTALNSAEIYIAGKEDLADDLTIYLLGSGSIKAEKYSAKVGKVHIDVAGSADLELGSLTADEISCELKGSADVVINKVKAASVGVSVAGSGDIDIVGTASSVSYGVVGSGDIRADYLKAKSGVATVSGSGSIRCNVKTLSQRVSGSGTIDNCPF
jgi:hypothetical protein